MALSLLSDYLAAARVLLQDEVQPYRYNDDDLVNALNMAFNEAFRVRPDLMLDVKYQGRSALRQSLNGFSASAPVFTSADESVSVPLPPAYKNQFLYFIVGQAQLRDVTDTQDTRASAFLAKFLAGLTTLQA